MHLHSLREPTGVVVLAVLLTACASLDDFISAPGVTLSAVEVEELDTAGQKFLLRFGVDNPNPFPLPVRRVSYGVQLDGERFVSGETEASFTIPAQGDSQFAISVEADLLRAAPALIYLVHEGMDRGVPYRLDGEFGMDLPDARPLRFHAQGEIRFDAPTLRAQLPLLP